MSTQEPHPLPTETTRYATSDSAEHAADDKTNLDQASVDEADVVQELPLDLIFEILKNRRRRLVLRYLRAQDDVVSLGELAEHIAAIENGISVQELNAQQRKRVYIGLYQCHLPKMADAEVIEFDQDRGTVSLRRTSSVLLYFLDVGSESPHAWYKYYYSASGAGALVLGADLVGLVSLGWVTHFVVVALFAVIIATTYTQRRHDSLS